MDIRLACAVLLLFVTQGTLTLAGPVVLVPIRVSVESGLSSGTAGPYSGAVVEGGVLLGALRRLQQTDPQFKFTVKENPDHGLYLESVNPPRGHSACWSKPGWAGSSVLRRLPYITGDPSGR